MTGAEFGSFILALLMVAIVVALAVWLLHWLYLRSSKERAFVRTGLGGQKVVLDGGAFVLPIVHDVIPVNMNTLRLEVSRGIDKALITKDRMRVDVIAEFYVRVAAQPDAVAAAAQTLGLLVVAIIVAIAVWLLHWLYLRSSKERAFVRTGLGGQKVVLDGGAFSSSAWFPSTRRSV